MLVYLMSALDYMSCPSFLTLLFVFIFLFSFTVCDLNKTPRLPYDEASFDVVVCGTSSSLLALPPTLLSSPSSLPSHTAHKTHHSRFLPSSLPPSLQP